jgi:uncharacterized phiE125 gp8 family phage protein
MTLKLITGPASEPITLAEAKAHCNVDDDDTAHDTLFEEIWIPAAREECEHELGGVSLLTQTWERVLDGFPGAEIELGMPAPNVVLQSVSSITYVDPDGASQTLAGAAYVVDDDHQPGFVIPADGYLWPETFDTVNAVRIRFVVGESTAADVPKTIKAWMLLRIATFYKCREEFVASGKLAPLPDRFHASLLDRYRRYR